MAIGAAGTIDANSPTENAPIRVDFGDGVALDNAVIVLTGTNIGGNQHSYRILESDETGFTFIIEEWEYHDGPHGVVETINWLAIEEGVHELPDGRLIQAGTAQATHNTGSETFDQAFGTPPIVITSVLSNNETTTVDSDPLTISETGFELRLQEEEGEDRVHVAETVGWIAIEPGSAANSGSALTGEDLDEGIDTYALGQSFTNPIVVADTQTINGRDPGRVVIEGGDADSIDLTFEEEQSADDETGHIDETVGIAAFEAGLIQCFTPGAMILTPSGEQPVETLGIGDLVSTRDAGAQPIRHILRRTLGAAHLAATPHLKPIVVRAGALGSGQPAKDLRLSPQHRILIEGPWAELLFAEQEVLAPVVVLVNDRMIRRAHGAREVEYIHLVFDDHQIIFANGLAVESLLPNAPKQESAGARELAEIFPEVSLAKPSLAIARILRRSEAAAIGGRVVTMRPV